MPASRTRIAATIPTIAGRPSATQMAHTSAATSTAIRMPIIFRTPSLWSCIPRAVAIASALGGVIPPERSFQSRWGTSGADEKSRGLGLHLKESARHDGSGHRAGRYVAQPLKETYAEVDMDG